MRFLLSKWVSREIIFQTSNFDWSVLQPLELCPRQYLEMRDLIDFCFSQFLDEMPKQYPSSQNGNDDIIPLEVVVKNRSTSFQKMGEKCPHCHQFMDVNGNIEDHLCRKAAEYIHSQGQTFLCLLCDMNFQNRLWQHCKLLIQVSTCYEDEPIGRGGRKTRRKKKNQAIKRISGWRMWTTIFQESANDENFNSK